MQVYKRLFISNLRLFLTRRNHSFLTLVRVLDDAFNHHNQVSPLHAKGLYARFIFRQSESSSAQFLYIQYQASILSRKKLYRIFLPIDKDEDITKTQGLSHLVDHNATKGIHPFSHVCRAWAKEVAHRVIKTEHDQGLYR